MVQLGFVGLSAIMAFAIFWMINYASSAEKSVKAKASKSYLLWLVAWAAYLVVIGRSGILVNFDLPPRMPMLIVFPAFFFIFLFLSRKSTKTVFSSVPQHVPVYLQSFRIVVELLIYGAFLETVLPKSVTFEGTNYDILVGFSALVMGLLHQKKKLSRTVLLGWNIISLGVLSVTVGTFIYSFFFSDIPPSSDFQRFVSMPYLLLPGFLMPLAVGLHAVSIRQAWVTQPNNPNTKTQPGET